ncbi:MAG: lipid-A-disaccharide synthase [Alphaproteobacteria bacterium]|nr:lipid-A-disaccharide synthase [Alphaproteobacteria bacterium]MBN2674983.1 lipid-A-disaccharide synthase [Alphaproteobacteria bacterium]
MHNKKIKIFVIAGEVSGDVLGAKIMHEMPSAKFIGIGGENMQAAGLQPIFPISDLAVMGLFEVLAHARTLTGRINQTVDAIIKSSPDIVLSIDSPSFAKRVIKKVRKAQGKKNSIKFYHVVAPQVWAWGEKRAKKFATIFDRLYCFFDFEVPYFTKYGLPTIPVGHPIADGLRPAAKSKDQREKRKKNITLIPGSRISEVKKLLPLLRETAECMCHQNPNVWYNFYIPVVETTAEYIRKETADWCTKPELVPAPKRYDLYKKTDVAIAASGTISAELAIMHIPTIVVYKMNSLTMFLARYMVKIKWASLVNILLNKTVYPELLGNKATAENIITEIKKLSKPDVRKKMINDLTMADKMWHKSESKTASRLIAEDINKIVK